jgi:hypothetical protein
MGVFHAKSDDLSEPFQSNFYSIFDSVRYSCRMSKKKRILILGAGFGGLELSSRLSEPLPDQLEITLIDKNEGFIF